MNELFALLSRPNVVVVDTLPKARLMNKLLLAKIVILTVIGLGLLRLAGWNLWMLGAAAVFMVVWTTRGYLRDVRKQELNFGQRAA
jgi:hypothetical protein